MAALKCILGKVEHTVEDSSHTLTPPGEHQPFPRLANGDVILDDYVTTTGSRMLEWVTKSKEAYRCAWKT